MNISKSVRYGLLAVMYIIKNSKDGLVKASSISKEYIIPNGYLTRIMHRLVIANILDSKRGIGGGYTLGKPAKEITMLDIIEAVDGPLDEMMEISQYTEHATFVVNMETICKDAMEKAKNILQKVKFSEMIK